ncbi:MAG: protein kinase [Leptolyngbyaceae cyanobacterium bins.59]|nr:protein kinase [Leptolyngbyaceae cyanobacterium bins.59]
MQPPIPAGTILQGRYHLFKVLGQGGFGRTYLAEDQGRFNERCVVKEYIPIQGDSYLLEKSKELFQREAAVLYQIQHPQIPQFRTLFEQGRRLFLVQDYVEGRTYGDLLEEKMRQERPFSEVEVVSFLQQMLPVLQYIHSKNIIHRDISPDNIILRETDRLPVLIDFGVVKEAIHQMKATATTQGTTVGKAGFAPNEQLQTGKAYPSSDLYALAVTAIVLLTGRNPQDMLEEETLTWHWQQYVPALSPPLVHLLNRMINSRPQNRYQSAEEVAQVLRSLTGLLSPASASPVPVQTTTHQAPTLVQAPSAQRSTPRPTPPAARRSPARRTPSWVGWSIAIGVLALIGILPWIFIQSLLQSRSTSPSRVASPTVSPAPASPSPETALTSPTVSPSPAVPSPSPSPTAITDSEVLAIGSGEKRQVTGQIGPNQGKRYLLNVQANQRIVVNVLKGTVALDVRFISGEGVKGTQTNAVWESTPLTQSGTYQLDITAPQISEYTLEVSLQDPSQLPAISPSPSPGSPGLISPNSNPSPSPESSPSPSPESSPAPEASPNLTVPPS